MDLRHATAYFRTVLHHQGARKRHGAGTCHGLRSCETEWRRRGSRFRTGKRLHVQDLSAPDGRLRSGARSDLAPGKASKGNDTILLVEDEEALLNLTAEVLTDNGYTVLPARDGIQALEVARSFDGYHPSFADRCRHAEDGRCLLWPEQMARSAAGIRILFMTGNAGRDPATQGAFPASAESLQKPFRHEAPDSPRAPGIGYRPARSLALTHIRWRGRSNTLIFHFDLTLTVSSRIARCVPEAVTA